MKKGDCGGVGATEGLWGVCGGVGEQWKCGGSAEVLRIVQICQVFTLTSFKYTLNYFFN